MLARLLVFMIFVVGSLATTEVAHARASGTYSRTHAQSFDLLCPSTIPRAHLVVVVPDRESDFEYTVAIGGGYAREGFAVAVMHRTFRDVGLEASALDALAREILATSSCTIDDGHVGIVGIGAGAEVALESFRDAAAPSHVARVAVLPRAVSRADANTLVIDASAPALTELATTSEPTIMSVNDLASCDFRTTLDPCHVTAHDNPELENAQRNASTRRELAVESRIRAWLAFAVDGDPPPFEGRIATLDADTPSSFMSKTVVRPLLTVDALIGCTWRERDLARTSGATALLRVESGASFRKGESEGPSATGYSLGGYGEIGVTGDNDFLYGGGATLTTYGGPLGATISLGAYGRVASVNAGGIATGIFLGLRNLGMPDLGSWETETPIGVRVDGRFGLDARPERSISLLFEVSPLALMMMGAGLVGLTRMGR